MRTGRVNSKDACPLCSKTILEPSGADQFSIPGCISTRGIPIPSSRLSNFDLAGPATPRTSMNAKSLGRLTVVPVETSKRSKHQPRYWAIPPFHTRTVYLEPGTLCKMISSPSLGLHWKRHELERHLRSINTHCNLMIGIPYHLLDHTCSFLCM